MKKVLLTTMIVCAFLYSAETKAQLGFGLSVHIGNRPGWGVPGNVNAAYYYMPEIDCYYDVNSRQFIYEEEGQWMFSNNLPYYCRDYDLNGGYKVIVNEPRPYLRGDFYRNQYRARYNTYYRRPGYIDQRNIRPEYRNDRYDNRYEQRGYNDRYEQRRFDDRRNDRMDNRNDQRGYNNGFNQPRNDDRRMDQRNDNNGFNPQRNDDRRNNERMDNRNNAAPGNNGGFNNQPAQQRDERNFDRNDNRPQQQEPNILHGTNDRNQAPGQVRVAQRRG